MATTNRIADMTPVDIAAHGIPLTVVVEAKMPAAEREASYTAATYQLSRHARADERARTLHEVLQIIQARGEA